MARQIKETPVLKGDDARRFEKAMQESGLRKVSPEKYKRALKAFDTFNAKHKKLIGA